MRSVQSPQGQVLQVKHRAMPKYVSARISARTSIKRALPEEGEANNEKTPPCHSQKGKKQIQFHGRKYFNGCLELFLKHINTLLGISEQHISTNSCLQTDKQSKDNFGCSVLNELVIFCVCVCVCVIQCWKHIICMFWSYSQGGQQYPTNFEESL